MPASMVPFVWMIDDFLRNAETVREQALSLTYSRTGHYFGRGSVEQLKIDGLEQVVSALVRQPLQANWPANHAHSTCRLTLAEDLAEAPIHVDPNALSGILYLSRPEDCRGAPNSSATRGPAPTGCRWIPKLSRSSVTDPMRNLSRTS